MALKLTKAGDYAIRSMIYIASLPEERVVLRYEVAESERIPPSFMAKILRSLARAGLLHSCRGVHGGFTLARPASEINLLDIVQAIEGPMSITDCASDRAGCEWSNRCPANSVWAVVQERIADLLAQTTLEALVSAPRRNNRVSFEPPEGWWVVETPRRSGTAAAAPARDDAVKTLC